MGADNLLEATVVTPNGDIVTSNACQHQDLFFAIRGGGGGTYGVVINAVVKAFPTPQTTIHSLTVVATSPNITTQWWDLMAYIHSELPRLKAGGMQGYYYMVGPPVAPTFVLLWGFYLYDKPNGTAESLFAPIAKRFDESLDMFLYNSSVVSAPTFYDVYSQATNEPVAMGGSALGSRLLTERSLTEDTNLVARTFETIGPSIDPTEPSVCPSQLSLLVPFSTLGTH